MLGYFCQWIRSVDFGRICRWLTDVWNCVNMLILLNWLKAADKEAGKGLRLLEHRSWGLQMRSDWVIFDSHDIACPFLSCYFTVGCQAPITWMVACNDHFDVEIGHACNAWGFSNTSRSEKKTSKVCSWVTARFFSGVWKTCTVYGIRPYQKRWRKSKALTLKVKWHWWLLFRGLCGALNYLSISSSLKQVNLLILQRFNWHELPWIGLAVQHHSISIWNKIIETTQVSRLQKRNWFIYRKSPRFTTLLLRHLCIQDYGKVGSMRLKAIHPDAKADLCDFHIPVMLFTFFMNAPFFWIILDLSIFIYFHPFSQ